MSATIPAASAAHQRAAPAGPAQSGSPAAPTRRSLAVNPPIALQAASTLTSAATAGVPSGFSFGSAHPPRTDTSADEKHGRSDKPQNPNNGSAAAAAGQALTVDTQLEANSATGAASPPSSPGVTEHFDDATEDPTIRVSYGDLVDVTSLISREDVRKALENFLHKLSVWPVPLSAAAEQQNPQIAAAAPRKIEGNDLFPLVDAFDEWQTLSKKLRDANWHIRLYENAQILILGYTFSSAYEINKVLTSGSDALGYGVTRYVLSTFGVSQETTEECAKWIGSWTGYLAPGVVAVAATKANDLMVRYLAATDVEGGLKLPEKRKDMIAGLTEQWKNLGKVALTLAYIEEQTMPAEPAQNRKITTQCVEIAKRVKTIKEALQHHLAITEPEAENILVYFEAALLLIGDGNVTKTEGFEIRDFKTKLAQKFNKIKDQEIRMRRLEAASIRHNVLIGSLRHQVKTLRTPHLGSSSSGSNTPLSPSANAFAGPPPSANALPEPAAGAGAGAQPSPVVLLERSVQQPAPLSLAAAAAAKAPLSPTGSPAQPDALVLAAASPGSTPARAGTPVRPSSAFRDFGAGNASGAAQPHVLIQHVEHYHAAPIAAASSQKARTHSSGETFPETPPRRMTPKARALLAPQSSRSARGTPNKASAAMLTVLDAAIEDLRNQPSPAAGPAKSPAERHIERQLESIRADTKRFISPKKPAAPQAPNS